MSLSSRLYAVVDAGIARNAGLTPVELARAYLNGGASLLQLRAPDVDTATQLVWCQEVSALATRVGAQLIVNDRCDVALASGAVGLHLGQDDLPAEAARRLLGPEAIIGVSTHTDGQVAVALTTSVTYIATGPVYPTRTKKTGFNAIGLEGVRRAVSLAGGRPVVAIGGITLDTAREVIEVGAASVAVISDLLAGGDPERRLRRYLEELGKPARHGNP